jgi:hypothetical protein
MTNFGNWSKLVCSFWLSSCTELKSPTFEARLVFSKHAKKPRFAPEGSDSNPAAR